LEWLRGYVGRTERSVLVVDPEPAGRQRIVASLGAEVRTTCVADGGAAAMALHDGTVDCLVVGPQAPGLEELLADDEARGDGVVARLPVILFSDGQEGGDGGGWAKSVGSCTVRTAHSPERLLDQAALVLHREVGKLPEAQRQLLEGLHSSASVLPGKKVLIVD